MTFRSTVLAVCLFASLVVAPPVRGAPIADVPAGEPLCEEESVYGTVIVLDETLGIFGLLGTRFKFQSVDELDLEVLQGRMVKIDIGSDCGILDLRVLDSGTEAIT